MPVGYEIESLWRKLMAHQPLLGIVSFASTSFRRIFFSRIVFLSVKYISILLLLASCGKPILYPSKKKIRLSEKEVAANLKLAGFPDYMIPTMVCVAKHESSLRVDAQNTNNNGSTDHGLFQINDAWWLAQCGVDPEGLKDPLVNAKCAKTVFDRQGLMAWYAYQRHWSTCNNYQISNAETSEWEEWYPGPVQPKTKVVRGIVRSSMSTKAPKARCNEKKLRACLVSGKGWACFNRHGCKSD